jgi:dienelactone hydrolase
MNMLSQLARLTVRSLVPCLPLAGLCSFVVEASARPELGAALSGTKPLTMTGDIASTLVAEVDQFLLKQIDESAAEREKYWNRDLSSHAAYNASVETNRRRFAHILGVRDPRPAARLRRYQREPLDVGPEIGRPIAIDRVTWSAFGDVTGEGLELRPGEHAGALMIVVPDAGQTPEQLAGLVPGVPRESQVALRLAENGYRVIVPTLIDRTVEARNGRARLTNREFVYRSAFELGRHIIGYEVQKVLALVDHSTQAGGERANHGVGVFGYGEGGQIALYAAALDPRIRAICVSGYFDDRNDIWRQPIDRNVFGLLEQFGDAEVASLIAPRTLIVEAATGPDFVIPPGTGGAPGRLITPKLETVKAEVEKARRLVNRLTSPPRVELVTSGTEGTGPFGTQEALAKLMHDVAVDKTLRPGPSSHPGPAADVGVWPRDRLEQFIAARQARQLHELDRHNQQLLIASAQVRREFMKKLDFSSLDAFNRTIEPYRAFFADEVIGRFKLALASPDVRSRLVYDEPKFTGYEVLMDVFAGVHAYGILLVPKGLKAGEKRPVVVCQHGLEGRPRDVADAKVDSLAYHRFAVQLTEQGFITFAPQNLYIFGDRFRTLQRKANPLKKTLFSVMIPQHEQITNWLKTQPNVDPSRIAFYGLSYGGKSAMRIPPLVKNYCLSICSADFNEWVWKNASTTSDYSYVWSNEYEIFEFDLGSTFNYAEMAALIAPRPFMVERGHFDNVAPDEAVAYEFAKVYHLYDAKLRIGDRCAIEIFFGPHTINGKGTFAFLHKHMK